MPMRMEIRLARSAKPIQAAAVYQTCSTLILLMPDLAARKKAPDHTR
jgi:hypothetical protein